MSAASLILAIATFVLLWAPPPQAHGLLHSRNFTFRLPPGDGDSGGARTVLSFRQEPAGECLYDVDANVTICVSDHPSTTTKITTTTTTNNSTTTQGRLARPSDHIPYVYIHCRDDHPPLAPPATARSNLQRASCLCRFGNPVVPVFNDDDDDDDDDPRTTPVSNGERRKNNRPDGRSSSDDVVVSEMDLEPQRQPGGVAATIGSGRNSEPRPQDGPGSNVDQRRPETVPKAVPKQNLKRRPRNGILRGDSSSSPAVQSKGFVFCQVTDLTSISLHGLKSLRAFDMGSNSIRAMPRGFFAGLHNLEYISLSNNPIGVLPDGVFCGLRNLTYLDLRGLRLSGYPSVAFLCQQGSPPIRYLDVSHNSIEVLSTGALTTLATSLLFLNLSSNAINYIHSSAFRNSRSLQTLDLSFNHLSELPARLCQGLTALRRLHIASNRIFVLHALPLLNCTRLGHLDLSSNVINHIPQGLNLTSLQFLDLTTNDLRSLAPSMFSALPSLRRLDLSRNKIRRIETTTFSPFPALRTLNLSRNRLEEGLNFKLVFKHLEALTVLDLSSNVITSLGNDSFSHLWNLEHLDLSYNFLGFFNRLVFRKLSRLKALNLRANMISLLPRGAFVELAALQTLDLSENDIVTIENAAFPPRHAFSLDLSRNSLQVVPAGLKNTSICQLDMRWNYVRKIQFQAFHDMKHLERLQIGHNRIEEILPGAFASLSDLKTLSLDHNELNIDFEENVFKGLDNLKSLNLAFNNIHRLTDIFRYPSLQHVEHLNISYNPIKSIGGYLFPPSYPAAQGAVRTLALDGCNITDIIPFAFNNLENLTTILLRDNSLARFKPFVVVAPRMSVLLRGNPLICSCEMRWLQQQQHHHHHQQQQQQELRFITVAAAKEATFTTYHVEDCTFVQNSNRKHVFAANIDEFLCVSKTECDPKCDCFAGKEDGSPLRTVCSRRLTTLPEVIAPSTVQLYLDGNDFASLEQLMSLSERSSSSRMETRELYLNSSRIRSVGEDFIRRFPELRVLRLDKNSILTLPAFVFGNLVLLRELYLNDNDMRYFEEKVFHGLRSLRHLDLSGNRFRVIEAHTLAEFSGIGTLRSIQLEENPWECACGNRQFYHWLNYNYTVVRNRREIRCSRKIILDQHPSAFKCRPSLTKKIIVVGLILSVIVLAFCLAFFIRYRRECVACVYVKLGLQCCRYRDRTCKPFDIFLVYDRQDDDCRRWIESTFLPRLENGGKHAFKVFYPDRNTTNSSNTANTNTTNSNTNTVVRGGRSGIRNPTTATGNTSAATREIVDNATAKGGNYNNNTNINTTNNINTNTTTTTTHTTAAATTATTSATATQTTPATTTATTNTTTTTTTNYNKNNSSSFFSPVATNASSSTTSLAAAISQCRCTVVIVSRGTASSASCTAALRAAVALSKGQVPCNNSNSSSRSSSNSSICNSSSGGGGGGGDDTSGSDGGGGGGGDDDEVVGGSRYYHHDNDHYHGGYQQQEHYKHHPHHHQQQQQQQQQRYGHNLNPHHPHQHQHRQHRLPHPHYHHYQHQQQQLQHQQQQQQQHQHQVVLVFFGNVDISMLDDEIKRRVQRREYLTARGRCFWHRLHYELPKPGPCRARDLHEHDVSVDEETAIIQNSVLAEYTSYM